MEIKFRGKRVDNGRWYYGSYLRIKGKDRDWTGKPIGHEKEVHYIVSEKDINYAVYEDSVGQYINIKDINGVEIYSGDIVEVQYGGDTIKGIIDYLGFCYVIKSKLLRYDIKTKYIKVIGNKIDNKELYEELKSNREG